MPWTAPAERDRGPVIAFLAWKHFRKTLTPESYGRHFVGACPVANIALSTPALASGMNLVAATWLMVSAKVDPDRENRNRLSANPSSLLVFTKDLHFSDMLVDPGICRFASSNQAMKMAAENKPVVADDLALYGTYANPSRHRHTKIRAPPCARSRPGLENPILLSCFQRLGL